MDLIALCCKKCGAPLNFGGSLICVCGSCKTPHALVSSGKNTLHPVSFVPYKPENNGKMQISFKLQLARKIRFETNGKYAVGEEYYFNTSVYGEFQGENFIFDENISRSSFAMYVGKVSTFGGKKVKFLAWEIETPREASIEKFGSISVIPVEVSDGKHSMLAGHRVVVDVDDLEFQDSANELSQMIQNWFGVIPEVNLSRG